MKKRLNAISLMLLLIGGIVYAAPQAFAQSGTPPAASSAQSMSSAGGVRTVQSTELKGEVLKTQGTSIIIKTGESTKEIPIPGNITVTKNGMAARSGDIQPGDSVTVRQGSGGEVLSVETTSRSVSDWTKRGLPVLGIIALLVLLYAGLSRKASKPHIKTAST